MRLCFVACSLPRTCSARSLTRFTYWAKDSLRSLIVDAPQLRVTPSAINSGACHLMASWLGRQENRFGFWLERVCYLWSVQVSEPSGDTGASRAGARTIPATHRDDLSKEIPPVSRPPRNS